MRFEWDEAKRRSNLEKRGIDFLLTRQLFDGRPVITIRSSYADEERYLTTGMAGEIFVTVVWTRRVEAIRIISARRSRDGEVRAYRALYGSGN